MEYKMLIRDTNRIAEKNPKCHFWLSVAKELIQINVVTAQQYNHHNNNDNNNNNNTKSTQLQIN